MNRSQKHKFRGSFTFHLQQSSTAESGENTPNQGIEATNEIRGIPKDKYKKNYQNAASESLTTSTTTERRRHHCPMALDGGPPILVGSTILGRPSTALSSIL
jgi:hypothetical protein